MPRKHGIAIPWAANGKNRFDMPKGVVRGVLENVRKPLVGVPLVNFNCFEEGMSDEF